MSKAQNTKAHIIQAAARLFNQQGFAGASMADIMAATGLQKGGIYNHFKSKDEIAIAAFDFNVAQLQRKLRLAFKGQRHAIDRLIATLDWYEQLLDEPEMQAGCPILNTAIDSDDTHPALRQCAQRAMDQWLELFQHILERGIQRGEIAANLDTKESATFLIASIEGGVMMSKLYGDTQYLKFTLGYLRKYLRQLTP
jgi:TetR/AcrR family transcriptional regulator, transcriptional repressor for nem operon